MHPCNAAPLLRFQQVSINKNNKNKEHFYGHRYLLHRVILYDFF